MSLPEALATSHSRGKVLKFRHCFNVKGLLQVNKLLLPPHENKEAFIGRLHSNYLSSPGVTMTCKCDE